MVSVTWRGHHLDALHGRAMVVIPDQAIGIVEAVLVALAALEIGQLGGTGREDGIPNLGTTNLEP